MSSYIFGGIIGLMGIVAAILLFLVDKKLYQSSNVLDDLNLKYANNELSYEYFKLGMANYTQQWNYASYDRSFKIVLILFFIPSFALVDLNLYNLCCRFSDNQIYFLFICLNFPLIIFLLIVYELIFAPDTIIFGKWRPSNLMKNQYPFNEITKTYCGFLDIEDIKKLELNRFKKIKLIMIKAYDAILIYFIF